jgi:hypothetical protein
LDEWCLLPATDPAGLSIDFTKTVGLDPNSCAGSNVLNLPYGGDTVTYCYEVTNTGTVTLTEHDLVDTELGTLLSGFAYDLTPGSSVWITASATITQTTVNTATWTASDGVDTVSRDSSATVTVEPPNPMIEVTPGELTSNQAPETQVNQTLTINNVGTGDLDWNIFEDAGTLMPLTKSLYEGSGEQVSYVTVGDADFSAKGTGTGVSVQAVASQSGGVQITHSTDPSTITSLNSVSCNAGGLHTDNSYVRRFTLSDFGISDGLDVTSIDIGIETATGATGSQPVEVRLYTWDTSTSFTFGNFNLIGSVSVSLPDQALTIANIPVTGSVPAGGTLVVEFFTPNGQTAGNSLFVGSNANGQTDATFLAAADCGITEPTDTAAIGFPNMQLVMLVNGTLAGPAFCDNVDDISWATVSPTAGTTTGGGSSAVDVTFDSTGLLAGSTYTGTLCVASNDAVNSLVGVPLTLTVEAAAPSITLDKTVGTDSSCATTDTITVTVGTDVTYCYTVTNTGNVTLDLHDLDDSELGSLLSGFAYDLNPGESVSITETVTIMASVTNTATWTASSSSLTGVSAEASDTATVNAVEPEPTMFYIYLPFVARND